MNASSVEDNVAETPHPGSSKKTVERSGVTGHIYIGCGNYVHEGMHKIRRNGSEDVYELGL